MRIEKLSLPEVLLIAPRRFSDARGHFVETYNKRALAAAGIEGDFVQDNESLSVQVGTVRGLHYQVPPAAQSKIVRVLRGAVRDIFVDARKASPTFGRWGAVDLFEGDGQAVYIPKGFLHGFVTTAPDTVVTYKVDAFYDAAADGAVRWDSPDLGIDWGVVAGAAVVSEKDGRAPLWSAFANPF